MSIRFQSIKCWIKLRVANSERCHFCIGHVPTGDSEMVALPFLRRGPCFYSMDEYCIAIARERKVGNEHYGGRPVWGRGMNNLTTWKKFQPWQPLPFKKKKKDVQEVCSNLMFFGIRNNYHNNANNWFHIESTFLSNENLQGCMLSFRWLKVVRWVVADLWFWNY
jgi:hypothetical protein